MIGNILVIGELCEDIFEYGKCDRICPEAPVPVFNPIDKVSNHGMAGNVFNNVKVFNQGITQLIANKNKIKKIRYVDKSSNQMIMRYDQNDQCSRINFDHHRIGNDWDAIIISDYNKGFLELEDIKHISDIGRSQNIPVFLDTKKILHENDADYLKNIFTIKINNREYENNKSFFLNDYYLGNLIQTVGSEGAIHHDIAGNMKQTYNFQDKAKVLDLSGAGDTFMAALVVCYVKTKSLSESIIFANSCASYVVTQKGVTTVNKNYLI